MDVKIEQQLEELLESIQSYILKIPNGCTMVADYLREGDKVKAYSAITDFIEGIDWLTESFSILLQYDYVISIEIEKLNQILKEINEAIKLRNDTLLADFLEYEMADFFGNTVNIYKN